MGQDPLSRKAREAKPIRELSVKDLPPEPHKQPLKFYKEPPVKKIGMVRKKKETDKAFTVRALKKFFREHCKEQLKQCTVDSTKELDSRIGKKTIARWETNEGEIVCDACPSPKASDDTWLRWGEYMGFKYTFKGSKKSKITVSGEDVDPMTKSRPLKEYKPRTNEEIEGCYTEAMDAISQINDYYKSRIAYESMIYDEYTSSYSLYEKINAKYEKLGNIIDAHDYYEGRQIENLKEILLDTSGECDDAELEDAWTTLNHKIKELNKRVTTQSAMWVETKALYDELKSGKKTPSDPEPETFVYNPYGFKDETKPTPKPTTAPKVIEPKVVPKEVVKPKVVKKPVPKKVVKKSPPKPEVVPEPTPAPVKKVVKKPVKKVVKKAVKKAKATLKGTKLTSKQAKHLKDFGYFNITRSGKKHRITPSRVKKGIIQR